MVNKREKLAKDLGIPVEDASKIIVEKQKSVLFSEAKFHTKSLISIMDKIKEYDSEKANSKVKEIIKFLIARHANSDDLHEISEYTENISESMFDKDLFTDYSD